MSIHSVRWGSSFFLLLGVTSAAPSILRAADERAGTTMRAAATAPATRPVIPIVYVPTEAPLILTEEESKLILDAAAEERPKDRRLWFVAVVFNDGNYECWAQAVYLPDRSAPRLRKGRYAEIHLETKSPLVLSGDVPPGTRRRTARDDGWKLSSTQGDLAYVQVSRKEKPFPERGDPAVPAPQDIPFPAPNYPPVLGNDQKAEHITDDELVRLVDFVRSSDRLDDHRAPICSIVVAAGGDVFGLAAGGGGLGWRVGARPQKGRTI